MLSNTCKYGIRAVIYLALNAKENTKIGIKKISEELSLPAPFLGKILQNLAKNKILNSTKGPNGGFDLAVKPDKLSVYDIVKVIDGIEIFQECLIGMKVCSNPKTGDVNCPFYERSHEVRDKLVKAFKDQTIAEFVNGIKNADVVLSI
jgi:Rrf2 family protein